MNQGWLVWVWVQSGGKAVPAYPLIPDVHLSLSPAEQENRGGRRWTICDAGHMTAITIRIQRHRSLTENRAISLQTLKGTNARFASRFFWKRQIRRMRKEMFPLFWDLHGSRGVRAAKQNYKGTQCGSSVVRHWKISSVIYDWRPQRLYRLRF